MGRTAKGFEKEILKGVTKLNMTKGERFVAEALGNVPKKETTVLSEQHPFLRNVIQFIENRREWNGSATELLKEIGDSYTPPYTVTKLLNRYDYECFYKRDIVIQFYRTNRKRFIRIINYRYEK